MTTRRLRAMPLEHLARPASVPEVARGKQAELALLALALLQ